MAASFRTRITGVNTFAVAALLALAFGVIYVVVWYSSYAHLDEDLGAECAEVRNNLDWSGDSLLVRKMPEWEEAEHKQLEANPTFIQIVDRAGHTLFKSANVQNARFVFEPDRMNPLFFNDVVNGQRLRFGQFPLRNEAGSLLGHLTIAVSREEAHFVLHNLRWTLVLTYLAVLICLFVLLWYAASVAIDPVQHLMHATQQLNEQNLSARLPAAAPIAEMEQLTLAINELLGRLEASVQQQQQFIADVSHELRTPLTAIKGTLEVVLRKERTSVQYKEKLEALLEQTNRLHRLYDDMLTLARVEANTFPIRQEMVSLADCVAKLQVSLAPLLTAQRQTVCVDIPTTVQVRTDATLLDLIMTNLLTNAIKFNKVPGQIWVHWWPDQCTLGVTDEGRGIEVVHLAHIFDRFYRADDARSAEVPGHGIGLSIVKKACDAQHISVQVKSTVGAGTTFLLVFPV